jgi:hypothetical protein
MTSGLVYTGVTAPLNALGVDLPSGAVSGLLSGVGNSFTGIPGFFNILKVLQGK